MGGLSKVGIRGSFHKWKGDELPMLEKTGRESEAVVQVIHTLMLCETETRLITNHQAQTTPACRLSERISRSTMTVKPWYR
jgi:hypothetical protein